MRAKVEQWTSSVGKTWVAHHGCGWSDELWAWHNAFTAAYHHVQHDCGRREQPSSGGFASDAWEAHYRAELAAGEPICFCGTPWSQHGTHRYGGYTVTVDCMPPDPVGETSLRKGRPEGLYEGGMQEDPTPSHMGFPLRGAYTEAPTTDLGAITAEVGRVGDEPWEGFPLEGNTPGRTGGRGTGRWPWGRARG